jgi:hypothetical protein
MFLGQPFMWKFNAKSIRNKSVSGILPKPNPGYGSVVHEDFDHGWPGYEEPTIIFY